MIDDYESSTSINGILGLGPIGDVDLVGPNIIQYLDEQSVISEKIVTFKLTKEATGEQSVSYIGGSPSG